jgi:hypothetical protein
MELQSKMEAVKSMSTMYAKMIVFWMISGTKFASFGRGWLMKIRTSPARWCRMEVTRGTHNKWRRDGKD